jgi:DNA-binding transcriptional ArsR family regulator
MKQLPDQVLDRVADYFKVLSEPTRLRLLHLLYENEQSVGDLVKATNTSQANVSKHLKVMLNAALVTRRPNGTSAMYAVADEAVFQLCNSVCERIAERIKNEAEQFRSVTFTDHK